MLAQERPVVLAAGDDPGMMKLLSRALAMEGYRVLTASDSAAALDMVRARGSPLALVTLGFDAPGASGIEICRRLRELSRVPVIVLTARRGRHYLLRALEAYADDFLAKPFDIGEFQGRARVLVNRWGTPARRN